MIKTLKSLLAPPIKTTKRVKRLTEEEFLRVVQAEADRGTVTMDSTFAQHGIDCYDKPEIVIELQEIYGHGVISNREIKNMTKVDELYIRVRRNYDPNARV